MSGEFKKFPVGTLNGHKHELPLDVSVFHMLQTSSM